MKKIFLFHLLLVCPVIFLIWYIVFPNYLWLLEGNSFFSFTPDFAGIQLSLPSDWAQYVGAYLLQFFRFRTSGALVQMLFVLIVLLSADCIIARLTRNKGLLWLSFIPVIPIFFNGVFKADVSFGGTSIIIIVGVIIETLKQIESQMRVRYYKGFLND